MQLAPERPARSMGHKRFDIYTVPDELYSALWKMKPPSQVSTQRLGNCNYHVRQAGGTPVQKLCDKVLWLYAVFGVHHTSDPGKPCGACPFVPYTAVSMHHVWSKLCDAPRKRCWSKQRQPRHRRAKMERSVRPRGRAVSAEVLERQHM